MLGDLVPLCNLSRRIPKIRQIVCEFAALYRITEGQVVSWITLKSHKIGIESVARMLHIHYSLVPSSLTGERRVSIKYLLRE